jgi:hypothetical protein
MKIEVNIPEALLPGVAFARAQANAGVPATVEQDGEQVPNPAFHATDSDYFLARVGDVLNSWKQQADATAAPPPPPPVLLDGVPQEVTRRQARQALVLAGKFDLVQPAIDAIPNPVQRALMQSEWDDSQTFQRHRPALLQMAAAIGLASSDLDDLFTLAATL